MKRLRDTGADTPLSATLPGAWEEVLKMFPEEREYDDTLERSYLASKATSPIVLRVPGIALANVDGKVFRHTWVNKGRVSTATRIAVDSCHALAQTPQPFRSFSKFGSQIRNPR